MARTKKTPKKATATRPSKSKPSMEAKPKTPSTANRGPHHVAMEEYKEKHMKWLAMKETMENLQQEFKEPEPSKPKRKVKNQALRGIRRYQETSENLIPRLPFLKLVREIALNVTPASMGDFRWQNNALAALQDSAEAFITAFFEGSQLTALRAKRVTILKEDMERCKEAYRGMGFLVGQSEQ